MKWEELALKLETKAMVREKKALELEEKFPGRLPLVRAYALQTATRAMPPPEAKAISYATLARVLGNPIRWRVLAVLCKHEVLPRGELVALLGEERSRLSKHVHLMVRSGVIEYWHRTLFRIPAHFRVPGENVLDFGCALIRIDRVK